MADMNDTHLWFDRQLNPISVEEWCQLMKDHDYRQVALDKIPTDDGQVAVSTVWLGLDLRWWGDGTGPVVFETMVFVIGTVGLDLDMEQWRYHSELAARAGHDQALAAVRDALAHV